MVTIWGMSKALGPMVYGEREEEVFLGREITRRQNVSEDTAQKIDAEVRKLIDVNYQRAKTILTSQIDKLHLLANALIEYETLDTHEIDLVLAGKKLDRSKQMKKTKKTPPDDKPTATAPAGKKAKAAGKVHATKEAGQGA